MKPSSFSFSLIKMFISVVMMSVGLLLVQAAVSGEQTEPKVALLRLEDVGPGGEYGTIDQLGKFRAVLEFLRDQGVPYQIGVIPKWVNYTDEGPSYSRSIDQMEDPYVQALNGILRNTEQSGAVVGMHGYTHQTGEVKRPDGHQESGIGNEFNIENAPETATQEFAEDRLKEGLRLFEAAGLKPAFWETPHYHATEDQHLVFRSYFGIIYEYKPGFPGQPALYLNGEKNAGYGSPSWGAAYVPTPFSYIPYNRDEKQILDQLDKSERLPSFFYHAFLEFKHLVPVTDVEGKPVFRDGVPVYRYPEKEKTILQKLINSVKERGYRFYSLYEYVPFTPSVRIEAKSGAGNTRREDVTGDGQLDTVAWESDSGKVTVFPGQFRSKVRNEPQPREEKWASIARRQGDLFGLKDENGDGKADLWILRTSGQVELYRSDGKAFQPVQLWQLPSAPDWEELYILRQPDNGVVLAGLAENGTRLEAYVKQAGQWTAVQGAKGHTSAFRSMQTVKNAATASDQLVYCRRSSFTCSRYEVLPGSDMWKISKQSIHLPAAEGILLPGDFNGDGREDILNWNAAARTAVVYRQTADSRYEKLSAFGPWGDEGARPVLADFDGNGKTDLAVLDSGGDLDTALSFQPAE